MKVFEYVIFVRPADEAGKPELLTSQPKLVLAKTEQEATMRATMSIPDDYKEVLDRVTIAVRPF